jgi:gamma-tubulin complex component 5
MDAKRLNVTINSVKFSVQSVKPLSSIEIGINIPWPVLEIIPSGSLEPYQRIFTLLLQIYRAKYLLRQENTMIRHFGADKTTVSLKQRLTWFVDNLQSYVLEIVLLPAVHQLRKHIIQAEDVDALLQAHESFIDKIQTQCLLTKNVKPIHDSLVSLLDLAVQYSNARTSHLRPLDMASILKERTKHRKNPRHTFRCQQQHDNDSNESSQGPDTTDDEEENGNSDTGSASYDDQLAAMSRSFTDLCNFIIAGLRGISRTTGETCWEMLAERLEWGMASR